MYMFPAEVEQGIALLSCFNSHTVNKCLFCGAVFFTFWCFVCVSVCVVSLFKWPPNYSAKVLSSVLKCKKAMMCLLEKTCMLDKLHSGRSYSVTGHKFNVNGSTIYVK